MPINYWIGTVLDIFDSAKRTKKQKGDYSPVTAS